MRRDQAHDRNPTLIGFMLGCLPDGAAGFERYHCSGRAVFHVEFAENMLDVLADRAGLCTENDGNIVIAFAS